MTRLVVKRLYWRLLWSMAFVALSVWLNADTRAA